MAGISNVSAIWKAYYQPFDKTLKTSINNMLAPFGWILVSNATALPVVAVIVNGFDSGSIPAEAWVKFLENRPKFEKYLVPVTSSIVNLIRETYHHAMTELQKAGHEVQKLEHVIEQSVFYPAFAWIAVGSARIALILKQHLLESAPTAVQYGEIPLCLSSPSLSCVKRISYVSQADREIGPERDNPRKRSFMSHVLTIKIDRESDLFVFFFSH